MIGVVKNLLGLVKDWNNDRDAIYQFVAFVAGILAVAACGRGERPSDVIAGVMRSVGATRVGNWFEFGLPPLVTQPNPEACQALAVVLGMIALAMAALPLFSAYEDHWPVYLQARGLVGSRAAGTVWILLMFVAQFASAAWMAEWSRLVMFVGALVITVLWGVCGCAYSVSQHYEVSGRGSRASKLADAATVVGMVGVALGFVIVGPLLAAVLWLCSTESDALSNAKEQEKQQILRDLRAAREAD